MPNRFLTVLASSLLVLLAAPMSAAAAQGADDLRQQLARSGSEWVELESRRADDGLSGDERGRRMELEEQILELAVAALGKEAKDLSEEEIDTLMIEALTAHAPEAAGRYKAMKNKAPGDAALEGQLRSIDAALQHFQILTGEFPLASTGLVALMGEGLIHENALLDPWKHPLRYEVTDDGAGYRVTSIGMDGVEGTGDDRWVDGSGEIERPTPGDAAAPAAAAPPSGLGVVPAAEEIVSLALTEDGQGIGYVARRADGFWAGWGHGESGPFETLQLVACGSVARACLFAGARDGVLHLITPAETRPLPKLRVAGFVDGTTELFLLEQDNGVSRGTIAGREMAFGPGLAPGQASLPTLDRDGRAVAWRERLEDGHYIVHIGAQVTEPALWASTPVVLPLASGDKVAFRLWDGEKTLAVVGTDGFNVSWARDPVVSPDGASWAMAVCLDGRPSEDFEVAREQQCADHRSDGYSSTPAFATTRANLIVNGQKSGVDSSWSGDPVFTQDGSRWAYPVRDEEGQWHVHRASEGKVSIGPAFDEVTRPRFVLDGRHVMHSARRDGVDLLVCDSTMNEASWGVRVRTGADGYAWVDDDAGQRILVVASASFDDIASVARADEIDFEGFLPGTTRPVARLRDGEEWRVWVDGVAGGRYGRVYPTASSETAVGYGIEVGGKYMPAVLQVTESKERTLTPDGKSDGFDAVGEPCVGATGAIAFEIAIEAHAFPLLPDEYPTPTGGGSQLLVFQDGEWSKGPLVHDIERVLSGSDGRFVYRASGPEGKRVDQFADHVNREGPWYADIEQLQLRADGTPAYVARRDNGRECVVIDTEQTPAVGTIEAFEIGPDDMTPAWVVKSGGLPRVVFDRTPVAIDGEPIGGWHWSPGARHLIYRAVHVDHVTSATKELVVIANRDAPERSVIVHGDAVSAPRLVNDGAAVEVVAIRGGEPKAYTIPLD